MPIALGFRRRRRLEEIEIEFVGPTDVGLSGVCFNPVTENLDESNDDWNSLPSVKEANATHGKNAGSRIGQQSAQAF
jgi:hypothetical protein